MIHTEDPSVHVLDVLTREDEEVEAVEVDQVSDGEDEAIDPNDVEVTITDESVAIESFFDMIESSVLHS